MPPTTVTEAGLSETTQRHRLAIRLGPLTTCLDPLGEIAKRPDLLGVIVAMERGWPGSSHLRFASSVLRQRRRIWFYWPSEQAIECVDTDVLAGYWRLWTVCTADRLKRRLTGLVSPREPDAGPEIADRCTIALRRLYGDASPVPRTAGLPRALADGARALRNRVAAPTGVNLTRTYQPA